LCLYLILESPFSLYLTRETAHVTGYDKVVSNACMLNNSTICQNLTLYKTLFTLNFNLANSFFLHHNFFTCTIMLREKLPEPRKFRGNKHSCSGEVTKSVALSLFVNMFSWVVMLIDRTMYIIEWSWFLKGLWNLFAVKKITYHKWD